MGASAALNNKHGAHGANPPEGEGNPAEGGYFASINKNESPGIAIICLNDEAWKFRTSEKLFVINLSW